MKLTNKHGLYSVEIHDQRNKQASALFQICGGDGRKRLTIVALDMHDATLKAMAYLLVLNENKEKPSVLTKDGSLNLNTNIESDLAISSITFIESNLIF